MKTAEVKKIIDVKTKVNNLDSFIQKIKERGYVKLEPKAVTSSIIYSKNYTPEEEFSFLSKMEQDNILLMNEATGTVIEKLGTSYRVLIDEPNQDFQGRINLTKVHIFKVKGKSKIENLQQVIFISNIPSDTNELNVLFKLFKF